MDRIVVLNMGGNTGNLINLKLVLLAACFTHLAHEASSAPARIVMSFPTEDSGNKDLDRDANRSWWIPKRIPEYLTYNPANNSNNETNSSDLTGAPVTSTVPEALPVTNTNTLPKRNCTKIFNNGNIRPTQTPLVSNDVIQFTKYQQPEPKNPEGIRFPATGTAPASTKNNKFSNVIKPRFDNQDYVKNLFRWMNVH